jgi:hypothetical protein
MGAADVLLGSSPSSLVVLPINRTVVDKAGSNHSRLHSDGQYHAVRMRMTPSNPQVAAATSAALGLTPQPCTATSTPWTPGALTVDIVQLLALDNISTCSCMGRRDYDHEPGADQGYSMIAVYSSLGSNCQFGASPNAIVPLRVRYRCR